MKRSLYIFAGTFAFLVAAVLTAPFVAAQSQTVTLSDEQRARIVANCTSIKNTLNQLKASDALLRVNRGQAYESLSGRLMSSFNTRLLGNSLDAKGMVSVKDEYDADLATFRTTYQAYERQLITAIRIDCTKDPDAFHAAVEDARKKRLAVHAQVQKLHQDIDNYKTVVNDFYENFKRVSGAS